MCEGSGRSYRNPFEVLGLDNVSRRHINMGSRVYRTALPQFNQMFMNPVCWPTLSFAHPELPFYEGPHKSFKNSRFNPGVSQNFDLGAYEEQQVELAMREVSAQIKATGFEEGTHRGLPSRTYHDGLGLHVRFSHLGGIKEDRRSIIIFQMFAAGAEGELSEGLFGIQRGWLETPKHSLRALLRNPMSKPRLSVGELNYQTDSLGVRYNRYVRKPSRVWSFYRFEVGQQPVVLEELLNQAEDAGYEMQDMLGPETLPLAQFRGKRASGLRRQRDVLTITASQQNVGVELRSR